MNMNVKFPETAGLHQQMQTARALPPSRETQAVGPRPWSASRLIVMALLAGAAILFITTASLTVLLIAGAIVSSVLALLALLAAMLIWVQDNVFWS